MFCFLPAHGPLVSHRFCASEQVAECMRGGWKTGERERGPNDQGAELPTSLDFSMREKEFPVMLKPEESMSCSTGPKLGAHIMELSL